MLLTKECDYGIRTIRTLAGAKKKTVEQICADEYIPGQYAYKILKKLERAGFVQSLRGRDGGYRLVKPVDKITIFDIATAINENLFINECLRSDAECPNNTHNNPCTVHKELKRLQELLENEMRQKPISELLP